MDSFAQSRCTEKTVHGKTFRFLCMLAACCCFLMIPFDSEAENARISRASEIKAGKAWKAGICPAELAGYLMVEDYAAALRSLDTVLAEASLPKRKQTWFSLLRALCQINQGLYKTGGDELTKNLHTYAKAMQDLGLDSLGYQYLYLSMALASLDSRDALSALASADRAVELSRPDQWDIKAIGHIVQAYAYADKNELALAEKHLQQARDCLEKMDSPDMDGIRNLSLARAEALYAGKSGHYKEGARILAESWVWLKKNRPLDWHGQWSVLQEDVTHLANAGYFDAADACLFEAMNTLLDYWDYSLSGTVAVQDAEDNPERAASDAPISANAAAILFLSPDYAEDLASIWQDAPLGRQEIADFQRQALRNREEAMAVARPMDATETLRMLLYRSAERMVRYYSLLGGLRIGGKASTEEINARALAEQRFFFDMQSQNPDRSELFPMMGVMVCEQVLNQGRFDADLLRFLQKSASHALWDESGRTTERILDICLKSIEQNADSLANPVWKRAAIQVLDASGDYYFHTMRYAKAEQYWSLAGQLGQGDKEMKDYYGPVLARYGLLKALNGDYPEALRLYRQYDSLFRLDSWQRAEWIVDIDAGANRVGEYEDFFSTISQYGPELSRLDPAFTGNLYDAMLFTKGNLLMAYRQRDEVKDQSLLNVIAFVKYDSYRKKQREAAGNFSLWEALGDTAKHIMSQLCQKIVSDPDIRLGESYREIQSALGEDEVAVEFFYSYAMSPTETDTAWLYKNGISYWALVLRPGWAYPKLVYLCRDTDLDALLAEGTDVYASPWTEKLYDLCWGRLRPYLEEGETVYFSPGGLFCRVNMEVLRDAEGIQADARYHLRRLVSTKELLDNDGIASENAIENAVLYGGLTYDLEWDELYAVGQEYGRREGYQASRGFAGAGLRAGWKDLPASKNEVNAIARLLDSKGIGTSVYVGKEGSEESFKALSKRKASVLHLATHGFYLDQAEYKDKVYFERYESPFEPELGALYRSGLIFSGGQRAWLGETIPQEVEDGILLPHEILELDLSGVSVVVLSACETALGDIRQEGVMGLQYSFMLAGVDCVVMSLWQVNDYATSLLMQEFYRQLAAGEPRREALRLAQEKVKAWNSDPYYWAGFIMVE